MGIEHYWLSNLASTLSLNWAELQSPANRTPNNQELGATVHANLRWGVFKRFSVGVEYMAGKQRIVNGTEGFAQRIQFAASLLPGFEEKVGRNCHLSWFYFIIDKRKRSPCCSLSCNSISTHLSQSVRFSNMLRHQRLNTKSVYVQYFTNNEQG